jgi:hypothetical protein
MAKSGLSMWAERGGYSAEDRRVGSRMRAGIQREEREAAARDASGEKPKEPTPQERADKHAAESNRLRGIAAAKLASGGKYAEEDSENVNRLAHEERQKAEAWKSTVAANSASEKARDSGTRDDHASAAAAHDTAKSQHAQLNTTAPASAQQEKVHRQAAAEHRAKSAGGDDHPRDDHGRFAAK